MFRALKYMAIASFLIVLVIVIAMVAAGHHFSNNPERLVQFIEKKTDYKVEVGDDVELQLFPNVHLKASALHVHDKKKQTVVKADALNISTPLRAVLTQTPVFEKIEASNLTIGRGAGLSQDVYIKKIGPDKNGLTLSGKYAGQSFDGGISFGSDEDGNTIIDDNGTFSLNTAFLQTSGAFKAKKDGSVAVILKETKLGKKSRFTGDISVTTGLRPYLNGRIKASRLDITDFVIPVGSSSNKKGGDFDGLKAMNFDFDVTADRLDTPALSLQKMQMIAKARKGKLTLDLKKATAASGALGGTASLDASSSTPRASLDLSWKNFNYSQFIKQASGKADATLTLKTSGKTLDDMSSHINGKVHLFAKKGQMDTGAIDFLATDLLTSLLPSFDKKGEMSLNCAVADFTLKDSVATAETLFIDSKRVLVKGKGTINLSSQILDMEFNPKPKDPALLSLATGVHVEGNWSNPDILPDAGDVGRKVGGLALGAVTGGIGLIAGFGEKGASDKDRCAEYLKK